jgi:hypothetical protein
MMHRDLTAILLRSPLTDQVVPSAINVSLPFALLPVQRETLNTSGYKNTALHISLLETNVQALGRDVRRAGEHFLTFQTAGTRVKQESRHLRNILI